MNVEDIRKILVVGAGSMGQQIGLQCATHGYEVTTYDVSLEALETASRRIKTYAEQLVGQIRLTPEEADAAMRRISFTTNPEEGAKADLLSESVPENPDLKARVFAQFNKICPPHTIFTTNTSTLVPSMYADATGRPEKFAAFHFHQYVWDSNLVDVMPHPGTSPEVVQLLCAFARKIGEVPLVFKKEHPEYVVNAILGAMNNAAVNLVFGDQVATYEDVDRAVMIALKTPMGPFGGLDLIGLDVVWHIAQLKAKATGNPQDRAAVDMLKREFIDKGWLGMKTGRGFYTYPNPAYARPGFLTGEASIGDS